MIVENPNEYKFIEFQKSKNTGKKYDAILMHKKKKKIIRVPFGDVNYSQYRDTTKLKLYSHLDTNNKERRRLYRLRHKGEDENKYSSGYFSLKYLW